MTNFQIIFLNFWLIFGQFYHKRKDKFEWNVSSSKIDAVPQLPRVQGYLRKQYERCTLKILGLVFITEMHLSLLMKWKQKCWFPMGLGSPLRKSWHTKREIESINLRQKMPRQLKCVSLTPLKWAYLACNWLNFN